MIHQKSGCKRGKKEEEGHFSFLKLKGKKKRCEQGSDLTILRELEIDRPQDSDNYATRRGRERKNKGEKKPSTRGA